VFGFKTHVSIDRKHWFASAAAHEGAQLANDLNPANTASDVWADTTYRSKTNEIYLAKRSTCVAVC
jgi:hypothetical protein